MQTLERPKAIVHPTRSARRRYAGVGVLFAVLALVYGGAHAAMYTITGETSHVRTGPGGEYDRIDTLTRGSIVEATGRRGNWLEVKTDAGKHGWLFRGLAEPVAIEPPAAPTLPGHASIDQWIGDYWLLAIGIDRYQHWPTLKNAVHDTQALVKLLTTQYGFDPMRVIELYDDRATEENILREFLQLKNRLKPNDSLLIYYAGHGVLDEFDTASWIPVNARENSISDYLSADRINRVLGKLPARHIFLVADACYSGSLFTSRGATRIANLIDDRYFMENIRRMSRQALTSGGTEPVMDGGGDAQHSIFAHHLLGELSRNENPYLAATSLSMRVQQLVARNSRQEPTWDHLKHTGDENGEFFFLRNPDTLANGNDEPKEVPSRLVLHTYPYGAALRVNGEMVGTAPVTLTGLSGNVAVEATMASFKSAIETVRMRYDRDQTLVLRLSPVAGAGRLSVSSVPEGARWYLDGAYMGTTPDQAADIASGAHIMTLSKDGFPDKRLTIRIPEQREATIRVELADASSAAAGRAQLTRSSGEPHDQRHVFGMAQLDKLLGEFVGAYQARDRARLVAIAQLSPQRQSFIDQLFENYRDINLQLISLDVNDNEAKVTFKIDRLLRSNGDEVIPSPSWDSARILIGRVDNRWATIVWD